MRIPILAAVGTALLVAGCQTAPETRVTRFHLQAPTMDA